MKIKRLIALLISVMMIVTYLPVTAFAENGYVTEDEPGSDELLLEYFNSQVDRALGRPESAGMLKAARVTRRSKLNLLEQRLYDCILEKVEAVASGQLSNTEFKIDLTDTLADLMVDAGDGSGSRIITGEGIGADGSEDTLYDIRGIVKAVLLDNPYQVYWFDKTSGYYYSFNANTSQNESGSYVYFSGAPALSVRFIVSQGYRANGERFQVDQTKVESASAAAENAAEIIRQNSGKSDLEKLYAYRDVICEMTSYNREAAADCDMPYGDPWQLIWVFDGNDDTKVVCEGYSKAFQYLCDKSEFENKEIDCHSVIGTMFSGSTGALHMWNILHMDDGKNYMADITNTDTDRDWLREGRFLSGFTTGSFEDGYLYGGTLYTYDPDTLAQYDKKELMMSYNDYGEKHTVTYSTQHIFYEDTGGEYETYQGEEFFYYDLENFDGDVLTVDGKVYLYDAERNEFAAEDGSVINGNEVDVYSTQFIKHWMLADGGATEVSYDAIYDGCKALVTATLAPASEHILAMHRAKAATCTADGNSTYWSCSFCGKYYSDAQGENEIDKDSWIIPAKGHSAADASYTWNADYTAVTGTGRCTVCGGTVSAVAKRASVEIIKAPTESEKGEAIYTSEEFAVKGFEAQTIRAELDVLTPVVTDDQVKAQAAARAEAARQGTPDSRIPKVKGVKKSKVKKTSVTVKWTKFTKAQLKKSKATKYEIWVCPNSAFGAADTKVKTVGKGKSSAKISGLKKNTKYYVKVRAIRNAGGIKYVGKWSSRKTVKTPKK